MTPPLRASRQNLGWSCEEMARRLGCSPTLVRFWDSGERPTPRPVLRWAAALARRVGELPAPAWRRGE